MILDSNFKKLIKIDYTLKNDMHYISFIMIIGNSNKLLFLKKKFNFMNFHIFYNPNIYSNNLDKILNFLLFYKKNKKYKFLKKILNLNNKNNIINYCIMMGYNINSIDKLNNLFNEIYVDYFLIYKKEEKYNIQHINIKGELHTLYKIN